MDPAVDHVHHVLEQWAAVRPDLDVSPMGVIGRLHRLAAVLDAELRPVFARAGLGPGDFDVLATLRRSGEPFERTPSQLADGMMVTSGAVTKRVDRLVAAGLVERRVCGSDLRARHIRLTPAGLALVDDLVELHVANERRLLAALDADQQAELARLLATWAAALGA